jgi:hypothetical protein
LHKEAGDSKASAQTHPAVKTQADDDSIQAGSSSGSSSGPWT